MSTPTTILLQPEDSFRVAEALIREIRRPIAFSDRGLGQTISQDIAAAVERAVKNDLRTRKK
jgi:hypothetical protein